MPTLPKLPTWSRQVPGVQEVLDWAVPDVAECRRRAADLKSGHPKLGDFELVGLAIGRAKRIAAGTGAATGLASTPLTLVPAAAADAAAMVKIEAELVGTVAALLAPEALDDPESFRTEILGVIFPGVMSQALRAVGVRGAQAFTRGVIRRQMSRGLGEAVAKKLAGRMGIHLTEKAIATKALPIVAVGIGGGWNWFEAQAVGRRAVAYFGGRSITARQRLLGFRRQLTLPGPGEGGA